MPTLQFKGKNIIWNHNLSIPYHTLEEVPKLNFQVDKGDAGLGLHEFGPAYQLYPVEINPI